jgi:deoxyribodipyrimidine photolyase-related protein
MTKRRDSSPKGTFLRRLSERQTDPSGRRWLYVPYDQVTDAIGPLSKEDPRELGIVLVENPWKARRRPYHRQKIALIIANLRHFALEQAARGVAVCHVVTPAKRYASALLPLARELGPIRMMRPAERELRVDLAPLIKSGLIVEIPHEGWMTTLDQFRRSRTRGTPIWKMDSFYRLVRQETGILMEQGKPVGGKFSYDAENRRPWKGTPALPTPITFEEDEIKTEVAEMIDRHFSDHPGSLDLKSLPVTQRDADNLWAWAKSEAIPSFGPFEDAMSRSSNSLFHTRLSSLMNIGRLLPADLVRQAAGLPIDLPSKEGFIRQILGWREFVHHVHEETDGFRQNPIPSSPRWPARLQPGDAGYRHWSGRAWPTSIEKEIDGGAEPTFLGTGSPIPPAYWGKESGLACLDQVVKDVWREGYSHHITRLMVLANIAALLDFSARELTDWFWVAYTDAYDWVVEPNVLAMGTFSVGPVMTTKPYVSGSAYIDRMSDYCSACAFDPKKTCPITRLYWSYLLRHRDRLRSNPRLSLPLASAEKRSSQDQSRDEKVFLLVQETLARGDKLSPGHFVAVESLTSPAKGTSAGKKSKS